MGGNKISLIDYKTLIEDNKNQNEKLKEERIFYQGFEKPFLSILPVITNVNYSYLYLINSGLFLEKNLIYQNELYLFKSYEELKNYYLNLNKRIILPDTLKGLYKDCEYLLAENYRQEEKKILELKNNIDYYLNIVNKEILDKNVNIDKIITSELESRISTEISYGSSQKYEIPLLVFFGEYLRGKYDGEWVVYKSFNDLGEVFYYPDLIIKNEEINLWKYLRKVLYNEGDDKIFNFRYLLNTIIK